MSASDETRAELEAGLAELRAIVRKKDAKGRPGKPTRHHARAVLVPLGRLVLAGEEEAARAGAERVGHLVVEVREAWLAAIQSELELAGGEHAQSVDPRYLEHPRYDFEYTVSARERLEERLQACALLDLEVDEALLARISRADEVLEPWLRERDERGAST